MYFFSFLARCKMNDAGGAVRLQSEPQNHVPIHFTLYLSPFYHFSTPAKFLLSCSIIASTFAALALVGSKR